MANLVTFLYIIVTCQTNSHQVHLCYGIFIETKTPRITTRGSHEKHNMNHKQTFNSYYPASGNDELIQKLQACAEGNLSSSLYLSGPQKSGRTHLMHAACAHANELDRRSLYVPLGIHASISPALFEGVEALNLICIDDIDAVAGHPVWEEALFHLYNRIAEQQDCRLIVSASASPIEACFALPDLMSFLIPA